MVYSNKQTAPIARTGLSNSAWMTTYCTQTSISFSGECSDKTYNCERSFISDKPINSWSRTHSHLDRQSPTAQYYKLPTKLNNQQHLTTVARSKRVCTIRRSSLSVRSKCYTTPYVGYTSSEPLTKICHWQCYELLRKAHYKSTEVNSESAGVLNSACSL